MTRETLAGVKAEMGRLLIDHNNAINAANNRVVELEQTVRRYQSDVKELIQQRDVAQANELGAKLDVARLGGMLDAYRDARLIPPISAHETPRPYDINADPYAWRGR